MSDVPFYNLIRSSSAFDALNADVLSGNISHAYLLCSPDSLFVSTLARMFAHSALNIEGGQLDKSYADIHILPYFEEGKKKQTVYTADIDFMIDGLYIKPSMGDKKFYIIDCGQTMNASCQNKLLKSLEEPPPSAHIIIVSSSRSALMPTIVSRCKTFEPASFSKEQIYRALAEVVPLSKTLDFAASAARGSLESAYKMATDKKHSQMFDAALVSLLSLKSSVSVLSSGARVLTYKDSLPTIIGFFELIFRDIIVLLCGQGELIMLKCYYDDIKSLSEMFSKTAALAIMDDIMRAQKRLKGFGNAVSVVDELMFSIAQCKAKYKN